MAMEKKSVSALCILLLVLFASQETGVEGGRMCKYRSHAFKGPCFRSHNCALACRHEGFSGGHCHGFRHRCICTKLCSPSP